MKNPILLFLVFVFGLITAGFVALKLLGLISVSWWWIAVPIMAPSVLFFIMVFFYWAFWEMPILKE